MAGILGLRIDAGVSAVMTRQTLACRPRVAHIGRPESRVVIVAIVALQGCRNMTGRLAWGICPVVTIRAGSDGRCGMGKCSPGPDSRRFVTGVALGRCRYVACVFAFRAQNRPVMAVGTSTGCRDRVDIDCTSPRSRRFVAVIALDGRTDMSERLAQRIYGNIVTVVTA